MFPNWRFVIAAILTTLLIGVIGTVQFSSHRLAPRPILPELSEAADVGRHTMLRGGLDEVAYRSGFDIRPLPAAWPQPGPAAVPAVVTTVAPAEPARVAAIAPTVESTAAIRPEPSDAPAESSASVSEPMPGTATPGGVREPAPGATAALSAAPTQVQQTETAAKPARRVNRSRRTAIRSARVRKATPPAAERVSGPFGFLFGSNTSNAPVSR